MDADFKEKKQVTIQIGHYEDLDALDRLNPVGLNNWKSEFWDNRMQPSFLFTANDSKKLTGVEGYIGGYKLIHRGKTLTSHRSERTLVLPEMRGMGVFKKLIDACHSEALAHNSAFCWGATSAIKPFERAGFKGFTNWRKYYFIPLGNAFFQRWFPSISEIFKISWRLRNQKNFDDILRVGGLITGLIPSVISKSNLKAMPIDFAAYDILAHNIILKSQQIHKDYALHVTADLLLWLQDKGISNKCFEILDENEKAVGGFSFRMAGSYFMVQDWFHSEECSSKEFFHAIRRSLRLFSTKFQSKHQINTVVFSLNTLNSYHQQLLRALPTLKVSSPLVGSFVIKSAANAAGIAEFRINPIWLDL